MIQDGQKGRAHKDHLRLDYAKRWYHDVVSTELARCCDSFKRHWRLGYGPTCDGRRGPLHHSSFCRRASSHLHAATVNSAMRTPRHKRQIWRWIGPKHSLLSIFVKPIGKSCPILTLSQPRIGISQYTFPTRSKTRHPIRCGEERPLLGVTNGSRLRVLPLSWAFHLLLWCDSPSGSSAVWQSHMPD
ncbi:hypothetical protein SCHPADRAFT_667252 [Schizopora paradoxa]|uniref:Uncharacterized protein n=1 Tax=Schizopora paradoxa TaxID=27342 RepID=A0A0H2R5I8_9AGAM|nr:hypothetical protein SCHPADRAFT_667252 [Schizopora paradoxa]